MAEYYLGNRRLKSAGVEVEFDEDKIAEFLKCSEDPIYFTKKYCKIVNVDKGLMNFELWPFQEEMIRKAQNNRFFIAKMPRQVGKTTTIAALLLWYALFHDNFSIAILANKERQAREILGRIQMMFEYLPKWLQQGVVEWNKGNIELENGSKILASSTSSSAIRGTSQNLVYLDEFAFVENNLQEEFFNSVYPTISSGQTSKVMITSTPNGMNMFYKIWTDAEEGRNKYVLHSVHWSDVPGRDAKWREETIANTSERQFSQEFECEFLGSSNTLIDPKKLRRLVFRNPKYSNDGVDIWYDPEKNKRYVIVVDTSRGVGIDYSAFIVFDVSQIPYRIVAKYRSEDISPLIYPNVIYQLAKHYNEAMVLVETNDIGQQVADIMHYDLEYDHVMVTQTKGRAGQKIGGGFGGKARPQFGVRTTKQVKRIGCGNLKTLIESDRLLLEDYDLIFELSRFIAVKASYEAEEGFHDDLVMCCVLFAWLSNQSYFKELTEVDVRAKITAETAELLDADMTPFGFHDEGEVQEEGFVTIDEFYNLDFGPSRSNF